MTVINTQLSIITLNINSLNYSVKRHKMAEWIKEQNLSIYCLQEIHLIFKVSDDFKGKGQAKVFLPGSTRKQGVSTLRNDEKKKTSN